MVTVAGSSDVWRDQVSSMPIDTKDEKDVDLAMANESTGSEYGDQE